MNFQVVSDLHIDIWDSFSQIPKLSDILILAGDIGNVNDGKNKLIELFDYVTRNWKLILYVLGNHEYWGDTITNSVSKYQALAGTYKNIIVLENTALVFDDYVFAGATMWADIGDTHSAYVSRRMNDFKLITDFSLKQEREIHDGSVKFFENTIKLYPNKTLIFISHHAPFIQPGSDNIRFAYGTDLSKLCAPNVQIWFYGHTHRSETLKINSTIIYSDQVGYPGETKKAKYNKNAVVEI